MSTTARTRGSSTKRARWISFPLMVIALCLSLVTAVGAQGASAIQVGGDINGEATNDGFGTSVAMSADGSRMVAGVPGGGDRGQVRVFDLVNGSWAQVGQNIDAKVDADLNDTFGASVAISADGSRIAAGNPFNNNEDGRVRVFDLVNGAWVQVGQDIDSGETTSHFGLSVALSADGSRLVAGAAFEISVDLQEGAVRVFDLVNGAWVQVDNDIVGEAVSDDFGFSVAVSADGSRVVAGARRHDNIKGHVRVFDLVNGAWTQVGGDIDGEASGDQFGGAVAVSADGSRVVASARANDGNGQTSGHVRVFDFVNGVWTQVGGDIDGEASGDRLGDSLAINADGSRIATGSPFKGFVRVFDFVNGAWIQTGGDIVGETNDQWGGSVAMSVDGSRIAGGASNADGGASTSGQVRVFDLPAVPPTVFCDGLEATVVGTSGDDVLTGTNGADIIAGLQGNDTISALGGDDIVCGGTGNDTIYGGQGFDIMYGAQGNDVIYSADGTSVALRSDVRGMRAFGGQGNDKIYGSDRWDRMQGGPGADQLFGYEGRDWMRAGSGTDSVNGGSGIDDLHGGNHNDTLRLTDGDTARGGAGGKDTCFVLGTPKLIISCEIRK